MTGCDNIADIRAQYKKREVTRAQSPDPLTKPPCSEFLADFHLSLRKRKRAICYRVRSIELEKILEHANGKELERLELECTLSHRHRTKVRVFVWQDRWVWVDARSMVGSSKGWSWEFTTEGRAIGGVDGHRLVQAVEASISAGSQVVQGNGLALAAVWKPLLAAGPRLVT